jgi:hypothetical protein
MGEQYGQEIVSVWGDRFKGLQKRSKSLHNSIVSTNRPHSSDEELDSIELTAILSLIDIDSATLTQLKAHAKADRSLANLVRLVGTKFSLNKK